MTQPDTLHDRIRAEIDRRLAVARAAVKAPSYTFSVDWPRTPGKDALIAYYALHDPADAVRRYEGELAVQERHERCSGCNTHNDPRCHWCRLRWPCPEIRSLAHRLGVSVDG